MNEYLVSLRLIAVLEWQSTAEGIRIVDPRGELDYQFQIPQNKVAAFLGIEATEHCDSAPTEWQVPRVRVFKANGPWSEIECAGSKDAIGKIQDQAVVIQKKLLQVRCIVLGGPCSKDAY